MAKRKVNKSEEVRKYIAAHPDAGPSDIAKALKKLKISAAYVSTIKSKMKSGSVKKNAKRGRPPKSSSQNDMESIIAAAAFISHCGDIDTTREALAVAEQVLAAGN